MKTKMNQKIVKELLKQLQQETQDPQDIGKLNIANIIIRMKKEAYEPTTIQRVVKELKHLERNCNTANPKEVKLFIANKTCSNANKENLTFAEVAQVILSGAASGMEVEQAKGIVTILKRYPNHYAALKMIIEVRIKQLNSLIED
jgi:hypothetical protein